MTIQRGSHIKKELGRSSSIKAEVAEKIHAWSPFVGQVCHNHDSNVGGTGFLIAPGVFMTCSHVIPNPSAAEKSHVLFHSASGTIKAHFDSEAFISDSASPGNKPIPDSSFLDFVVIPLKYEDLSSEAFAAHQRVRSIFKHEPIGPSMRGLKNVSIIHYPAMHGEAKKKIIGYGELEITWRDGFNLYHMISTESGSSGAPIFNEEGKLLGMHRGQEGTMISDDISYGTAVPIEQILESLRPHREKIESFVVQDTSGNISASKLLLPPKPPKDFTGRTEERKELEALFEKGKRVVISGLGGIGKTALALKYVKDHQKDYKFTHFIQAASAAEVEKNTSINRGLMQLADALNIREGKVEERLSDLKVRLQNQQGKFLLIFDGIDHPDQIKHLKETLPDQGDCLFLLTSRVSDPDEDLGFKEIHILPLRFHEAVEYLLVASETIDEEKKASLSSRLSAFSSLSHDEALRSFLETAQDPDEKRAALLANKLGYHSLALKQVVAFIKAMEKEGITLKDYYEEYEKQGIKLLEPEVRFSSTESVLTTWKISLDTIAKHFNCPFAVELLQFLSLLADTSIPIELTELWCKFYSPDNLGFKLRIARNYLSKFSLIEREGNLLKVHKLVQEVTYLELEKNETKKAIQFAKALETFVKLTQNVNPEIPSDSRRMDLYVPHLEKFIKNFTQRINIESFKKDLIPTSSISYKEKLIQDVKGKNFEEAVTEILVVIEKLWGYHYYGGHYQKSKEFAEENLELLQHSKKDLHQVSHCLILLGMSLSALGKHEQALKYQMQALELRKELLGEKHLDVASSYNNVGVILEKLGRNKEALEYQMGALELMKKLLGEKHLHVTSSYYNVGVTLGNLGKHVEALYYLMQALELRKELLGEKHPDMASIYSNVGITLGELGRDKEALQYQMQALELRKELHDEKHPDIASSYHNIGISLKKLGRHEEALHYKMKALGLMKEQRGEKHPYVALGYNNVGSSLEELGRHEEALQYKMQALKLMKALRKKHPYVASIYYNVGSSLKELGRHNEAFQHKIKALELRKELLGEKHPDVASSYYSLGDTLNDLGEHEQALQYHTQALELRKELHDEKHPDIASIYDSMGTSLGGLGRHEEAFQHKIKALELRKELLGEKHHDVASSYYSLGDTLNDQGKHEEALQYHTLALKLRKELHDEKHPDIASIYDSMGTSLGGLGRHEEAFHYCMKALELRKKLLGEKHPKVSYSYNSMGITLGNLGRHEEALQYHMQALELVKELLGEKHPNVALGYNNVESYLEKLGRHEEALQYKMHLSSEKNS